MALVPLLSAGSWLQVVLYVAAGLALGVYGLRVWGRLHRRSPAPRERAEDRAAALLRQHRANERPVHRWKATPLDDETDGEGARGME